MEGSKVTVFDRVIEFLAVFGEEQYQVPMTECERMAKILSQEFGKQISGFEVKNHIKRFKRELRIPSVRGRNGCKKIVDGKLVVTEPSQKWKKQKIRVSNFGPKLKIKKPVSVNEDKAIISSLRAELLSLKKQLEGLEQTKNLLAKLSCEYETLRDELKKKKESLSEVHEDLKKVTKERHELRLENRILQDKLRKVSLAL